MALGPACVSCRAPWSTAPDVRRRLLATPASDCPAGPRCPRPSPSRALGCSLGLLLVAALLPRLVVFPVNENLYGDAVVRTELAERWLRAPHVITAYGDGAYQFGPLHLYLVGAAAVGVGPGGGGPAVSLLFGVLSVVPLFALTRRLFGWRAGVGAGLAFCRLGHAPAVVHHGGQRGGVALLHAGASSRSSRRRWTRTASGPCSGAAVLLNLACALRYDAWMYIPLLSVALLFSSGTGWRRSRGRWASGCCACRSRCCGCRATSWRTATRSSPSKAWTTSTRQWVADGGGAVGALRCRLQQLGFWPGVALFTLTPRVALLGVVGMVEAWRQQPETRWLVLAALVPAAYFTFRAAVLLDFVPLARFTVTQLVLLLPFVATGAVSCSSAGAARPGRSWWGSPGCSPW